MGLLFYFSNIHHMSSLRHMDYNYNTRKAWLGYLGIINKGSGIINFYTFVIIDYSKTWIPNQLFFLLTNLDNTNIKTPTINPHWPKKSIICMPNPPPPLLPNPEGPIWKNRSKENRIVGIDMISNIVRFFLNNILLFSSSDFSSLGEFDICSFVNIRIPYLTMLRNCLFHEKYSCSWNYKQNKREY